MGPDHYFTLLDRMHRELEPKTYFEIGTESGASLHLAKCTSYAVDPAFRLAADVTGNKPELYLFQGTSDDFFASDMLRRMDPSFDLAFLDGMHLFEFLLRDFMNSEKRMAAGGCIAMHDCVPMSMAAAERDWNKAVTRQWVGDVWKVVSILRKYRPDLNIEVVNAAPSGLVVVRNLDPTNRILDAEYNQIVRDWSELTLADYGLPRLLDDLDIQPFATQARQNREALPARPTASNGLRIAIKTPVKSRRQRQHWGDWHFAESFAKSLAKLGHEVRVDCVPEWGRDPDFADVDIVLRGHTPFAQRSDRPHILWVIYPGRKSSELEDMAPEFQAAQHIALASLRPFKDIMADTRWKTSQLMQAFDASIMYPSEHERKGIVFVGNNFRKPPYLRRIVEWAIQAGAKPRIFGRGYEGTIAESFVEGLYVDNAELGTLYRSAQVVLCDHMPAMVSHGFISNRIYDALACGVPVICDSIPDLPKDFRDHVALCSSSDDVERSLTAIKNETYAERAARHKFAAEFMPQHSFDARARAMDGILTAVMEQTSVATTA